MIFRRFNCMMARMDTLSQILERVIETSHPLRVILFGSTARGVTGPDSDIDLLVVMPEGTHRLKTAQQLHAQMFGVPAAVDFLVATESDLKRHLNNPGLIYRTVLQEGKELYAA